MTTEKSEDANESQEWKWDEKTTEKDYINVVSGEGDIVPIHKALLEWSEYANLLHQANKTQITVRLLNGFQLKRIAKWIFHHRTEAKEYYERRRKNRNRYRHRMNNIPPWDSDFLNADHLQLSEITKAAAILGIGLLKDFIARLSLQIMAKGDIRNIIANFDDGREKSHFRILRRKYKRPGKLDSMSTKDRYYLHRKMQTAEFTL